MIEVKGLRGNKPASQPVGTFEQPSIDRKSNAPLAIGAALTAVATYLKSILWITPAAHAQPAEHAADEAVENAAPKTDYIGSTHLPAMRNQHADSVQQPASEGQGGPNVLPFLAHQVYVPQQEVPLNFVHQPSKLPAFLTGRNVYSGLPANDNGGGFSDAAALSEPLQVGAIFSGAGAGTADEETGNPFAEKNRAPRLTGPVQLNDLAALTAVLIGVNDLLRGATDEDHDSLAVVNLETSSGELRLVPGGWLFKPLGNGPVEFSFGISDGTTTVQQHAHFSISIPQALAEAADARAMTTLSVVEEAAAVMDAKPVSSALAPIEPAFLLKRPDAPLVLAGDELNNQLIAGDEDSILDGFGGNDSLFGGAGNDILRGGTGDDLLKGGAGQDLVQGEEGNDTVLVDLDQVSDSYEGGEGQDILDIGSALQAVTINLAMGTVTGQETGSDQISGFETIVAGAGDDTIIAAPIGEALTINGGEGFDTVSFAQSASAVTVDTAVDEVACTDGTVTELAATEKIIGSQFSDVFLISDDGTVLSGGGGDDVFALSSLATSGSSGPGGPNASITDFEVGDIIRLMNYDIFERTVNQVENAIEQLVDNLDSGQVLPIRFRDGDESSNYVFRIEADTDNDSVFETVIELEGHHNLQVSVSHIGQV